MSDDRCCSYDCIWKLFKLDQVYKDEVTGDKMIDQRNLDFSQFQDLRVMSKKAGDNRKTLSEFMRQYGYEFRYMRDENGDRIIRNRLFAEVMPAKHVGMFLCVLKCDKSSTNHFVCIAKYEDGSGSIYDSNHTGSLDLCSESLDQCLQNSQFQSLFLVWQIVKQRVKKKCIAG